SSCEYELWSVHRVVSSTATGCRSGLSIDNWLSVLPPLLSLNETLNGIAKANGTEPLTVRLWSVCLVSDPVCFSGVVELDVMSKSCDCTTLLVCSLASPT